MANNVLKYKGNQIGKSIKEDNCDTIIDEILKLQKNTLVRDCLSGRCFGR